MLKRRLSIAFIVGLALVLGVTAAPALAQDPGDPSGNGVQPVYVAGNPTCTGLGYDFGFKPQVGEDDFDSGYFEGSPDGINTITADSDGTYVDWTSTLGIDAVIVKGGPNANVYVYDPPAESFGDSGLTTPGAAYDISHIEFCYDYELDVTKDAAGTYDRTHTWDIEKSVDPTSQSGFAGELLDWTWTVDVSESALDSNFAVTGKITINNATPFSVDFSVADSLDDGTAAVVVCPAYTVLAGGSVECSYTASPTDASATENTVIVTSLTANVDGDTASAPVGWTATVYNGTADVDDDQETDFPLTLNAGEGPWQWTETQDHTCSANRDDYDANGSYSATLDNYATVTGSNGQSDNASASTTYTCYIPSISKDAAGTYDERHEWDVEKTVDPESQSAFAGDTVTFDWTITVDETIYEENFDVKGKIYVGNPNPNTVLVVPLVDSVNGNAATISGCTGGTWAAPNLTVPAGGLATCEYTANDLTYTALVDAPDTNTAKITLNGIDFEATDPIEWTATVIRGTATLDDDQYPYSDESVSDGWTDSYEDSYTCSSDLGDYSGGADLDNQVSNTAEVYSGGALQDSDTATTEIDCYIPSISKTAAGTYDEHHSWTVTKTVTPLSQAAFIGETVYFDWTITVFEDVTDENFDVAGTITVGNPNPEDALVVPLVDSVNGNTALITGCTGEGVTFVGGTLTVPASGTAVCNYAANDLSYSDVDQAPTLNTAKITLNGIEFPATDPIEWTKANVFNANATLDDDQYPYSGQAVYDGWTDTYQRSYTCSTNAGDYSNGQDLNNQVSNTAEVYSGGALQDSDSATTEIDCYAPTVSKTADGTYTRTYKWKIEKTADQPGEGEDAIVLSVGQVLDVNFEVTIDLDGYEDTDHKVTGQITITNPHPSKSITVGLSDTLSDGTLVTLDCNSSVTVDPGTKVCNYEAYPSATGASNTAAITYGLYSDSDTVTVNFIENTVDECVKWYDTNYVDNPEGYLGTVCATDFPPPPVSKTYVVRVEPTLEDCGESTLENTARFETIEETPQVVSL